MVRLFAHKLEHYSFYVVIAILFLSIIYSQILPIPIYTVIVPLQWGWGVKQRLATWYCSRISVHSYICTHVQYN